MYLPISWLRELVDIDGIDMKRIEEGLFSCGLEVEEKLPVSPDISGVYAGIVKSIVRHPDSDHMFICLTDCGDRGRDVQIVTGAQNVAEGDVVPVALEGARVYSRRRGDDAAPPEAMTIKAGKLRGVDSHGMLCSGEELGIDEDWYEGAGVDGIMKLPEGTLPGADLKDLLGLNDEVWDISVTANLPHCQSVFGVARELSALLDRPLRMPDTSYSSSGKPEDGISISVSAPDLCPRYIGHYVGDVKIKKSPEWMRRRLKMCGHNAINTIVDITNYLLVEMGQPMHAFDMAKLRGRRIDVRRAGEGEKIITLDGREFTLKSDNLVICDAEGPIALAGIMGGLESGIGNGTREIIFEAAKFERGSVRRTSRALGQSSDSSRRFEKGVDEYTTRLAMDRALHLIEETGSGAVGETDIDVGANQNTRGLPIATTHKAICGVLGIEVPAEEVVSILRRMNYTVVSDGVYLTATPPGYREDIEGSAADLAEDVIKMHGYSHIIPRFLEGASVTAGGHSPGQMIRNKFMDVMCAAGFSEIMTFSFYSPAELDALRYPADAPEREAVRIENPISEKYTIMRTTLAPSLVAVLSRNAKRGYEAVRVCELARVFAPNGDALPEESLPREAERVGFGLYGGESFFTAKGVFEDIAEAFGVKFDYERTKKSFLHPGASARVLCGGEEVGYFGQLAYEIAGECEIAEPAFVGEIDYAALAPMLGGKLLYSPVSPYRDIRRDIALLAPEEMSCGQIEEVIRAACKQIREVRLFDVYRGAQVGEGMRSLAFNLTFAPDDRELMPEDADKFVAKILRALEFRLGLKMRA